ncbi:winged helix-turn-helix domain-containing protein, partial [Streptomyces sp. NPDC046870]|uniref:ArsR/SmtB family transcription factor n=1 Tax=Streptomyces sp. NPDC046870 TaxID=3155135 RepID=UPI00345308E8
MAITFQAESARMQALVDAERAVQARTLLDSGSEGLLAGLGPAMRWRPPVLQVNYPVEHDIHLDGRGLVLVPSVFCWRVPITLIDPSLPPVLVYPLPRTQGWWSLEGTKDHPKALSSLLGPTRAACLRLIEDGCTTGELARRTGVAPPTASQHATALREAGLTTSTRQGNTVLHTLTPLRGSLASSQPGASAATPPTARTSANASINLPGTQHLIRRHDAPPDRLRQLQLVRHRPEHRRVPV